jgi:signal transduction histidine kinase
LVITKKIVSENHKYNKTKQATIRSLKKGYTAVRIIHKPGIVMDDFGMNWYLGMLESYARLAGLTNIIGKMTCVERGPQQYGHPGQAIYDFEITFKDPGFLQRIFNLMLYAVPAVRELIESTEFIQAKHNDQIIHRDKIIKERTDHLLGIQKKLMDAERINIERKLENLSFELITTEERERKAIAEDLHDSVTQLLALSVSSLKGYNRENPGQTVTKEVQEYLQTALADTRSLTFQISPPVLYDFGLEAALEWLVSDICMRHPIEMDFFNLLDQPLLLNDFQKATLYRSVREAVINCIKHAKAKYASVALHVEDGKTRIDIEDNGIGFDPINLKRGFGLSALGDRLQNIGAGIDIISSPGEGSLIKIFLPEEKKIAFKNE